MAYTPPSSGALVVEVADSQSYTPPLFSSLNVELAASGGFSGTVSFVASNGALSLTGYPPVKGVLAHTLPAAALSLTAYAPTYAKTRTSTLSATGALSLTGLSPLRTVSKITIPGGAGLTLTPQQPTYFRGKTQSIVQQGSLSLTAQSTLPAQRATYKAPVGSLSLTAPAPLFKTGNTLSTAAALTLAGLAPSKQVHKVRRGVSAIYSMPDVTLDTAGSLVLAANAGISAAYHIRKGITASSGLTSIVAGSIVGVYTARVANAIEVSYALRGLVSAGIEAGYAIRNTTRISSEIVSSYRFPVAAAIESSYSLPESVRVRKALDSTYSYTSMVRAETGSKYSLTSRLVHDIFSFYSIESAAKARASVTGVYSSPDAQVISITQEPYIEYQSRRLRIEEAEITAVEGDQAWTCSVILTDVSDYAQLRRDQAFDIVIGSERYSFIVDSKELDRSNPANYGMKLMGISPSAKLTSPRMLSFSCSWDVPMLASDIAKELIPGLDWQVIDWVIPAYRFSVQDTTAIEAVKTLAAAIGATLEADLDGSLFVRSLYTVSVPDYAAATPSHVFLEETDIINVNESYVSSEIFNRLIITDTEQSIADSLEWIEDYDGAVTGILRAYLYPWRSGVTLRHTGRASVSLAAPNVVMEQHEEYLEVFQGQGSTQYPIHHIDSVEYEAQNTGALTFDVDSRNFTVAGPAFNSVIRLVYWSRSLDYRAALPEAKPTQFLLESDPL